MVTIFITMAHRMGIAVIVRVEGGGGSMFPHGDYIHNYGTEDGNSSDSESGRGRRRR